MSDWLPPGLFAYGAELAAALDRRLGRSLVGDGASWIDMPRRLGTADVPSEPVPWGEGALCIDLGPDDTATWERFVEVHWHEPDPESIAVAAQEWRLPVTPYRRLPGEPAQPVGISQGAGQPATSRIDGVSVVDLTSMWAGPLCTELLGRAGAEILKITSDTRPDGLTGSPMYAELNEHKTMRRLDLRQQAARESLDARLGSADLLVTSLSPRALANLELLPQQLCARHPHLRTLAITAFGPDAPEREWIAYGTGVHAASGLGWLADEPQAPAYSYPDPLAGLQAACSAVDQLSGAAPQHTRVSLAGAVAPLASRAAGSCAGVVSAPAAGSGGDRHG
ncbi:CoA transferase [Candidatus Poriferisodalis sp.]|uniref:CoA transferase n=1 Tax=Candidatus Poriferisodalis sp. TaxID=3101277 RepID=UPI003B0146DD